MPKPPAAAPVAGEPDNAPAVFSAPAAVAASVGRFDGEWYQREPQQACALRLRVGHDTLGRYNVNIVQCQNASSVEAYTAYTVGDSLHIYGVSEHHSPEMWLRLEATGKWMLLRYAPVDFRNVPTRTIVRDTFWLDSTHVTKPLR